jgi:hypothetical protein
VKIDFISGKNNSSETYQNDGKPKMKKIIYLLVFVGSFLILSNHATAQAPSDSFKICADEWEHLPINPRA